MNIDELSIGQAKQLFALLQPKAIPPEHPFIGQYVIARCYAAGVHAGVVVSVDGENVILSDSRRLWDWRAEDGVALSGLAQTGLKVGCKVDTKNPLIYLTGVCELIPTAKRVRKTIDDA